ncbi:MAG: SpoIIE family protein phosphatase [Clostridia bacterium]|nr:SpoIIE family protein phosphatase [Clostridia bacterium]
MTDQTAALRRGSAEKVVEGGAAAVRYTLDFLCGFVLSGAALFGSPVPLPVGFAAACSGWQMIAAVCGAAIGGWFRLSGTALLNLLAPLCGVCVVKAVLQRMGMLREQRQASAAAAALLSLGCGVAVLFSTGATLGGLLRTVFAAGIVGLSALFYTDARAALRHGRAPETLDAYSLACIVLSLCTLLLGFLEVSVHGFRPARCFGAFLVLGAADLFAAEGGSIAGIAFGASVAVSGASVAPALSCGICGLTAGLFARWGRLPCLLAFLLTAAAAALLDGTADGAAVFAETAVAALAFALIPARRLRRLKRRLDHPRATHLEGEFEAAGARMALAADAVGSVADCVQSVAAGVEALAPSRDMLIRMRLRERVCSRCPLDGAQCPEDGALEAMMEKRSHGANPELSAELEANANVLCAKERAAARVFDSWEFSAPSVRCVRAASGELTLTCCASRIPAGVSLTRLTAALSSALEVRLAPPQIRQTADGQRLTFQQQAQFRVRTATAGAGCGGRPVSGDYATQLQCGETLYLLLSDGMGTGGRAAVDAAMTVELFARMLRGGISPDSALAIVNAALTVRAQEEALATLDVAAFDLLTGQVTLLKAGAAESFYSVGSSVRRVEQPSTPLGILSSATFARTALQLRGGDVLAMVSDGTVGCGSDAFCDCLRTHRHAPVPEDLAALLLAQAQTACGGDADDMTVIVAQVEEL